MEEFKPGQVISPHSNSAPSPEPTPTPTGAPEPERPTEPPAPPSPTPGAEPDGPIVAGTAPIQNWQFNTETSSETSTEPLVAEPASLDWTAAEFIAHEKTINWYGSLAILTIVVATLIFLVTKDRISTGIVVLAGAAFGAFAMRKPKMQQYAIFPGGLQIGQKTYNFQDYKTFSVIDEGAIASIIFMPLKRFMPPLTVYVAPDLEDKVVDFLAAYLPFEQHKADAVDSLLRRIRF
jgi:hypothetical protein